MKKLFLGFTILAFVLMGSRAMAAGPKVPKSLCFNLVTYAADHHQLAIKNIGTVPTSSGNVKMYMISGYAYTGYIGPVHGSGYVAPGTTILHATYSGKVQTTQHDLESWELFYDLSTNSGPIYVRYDRVNGTTIFTATDSVTMTDCATLSIPSAMDVGEIDKAEGQNSSNAAH